MELQSLEIYIPTARACRRAFSLHLSHRCHSALSRYIMTSLLGCSYRCLSEIHWIVLNRDAKDIRRRWPRSIGCTRLLLSWKALRQFRILAAHTTRHRRPNRFLRRDKFKIFQTTFVENTYTALTHSSYSLLPCSWCAPPSLYVHIFYSQ